MRTSSSLLFVAIYATFTLSLSTNTRGEYLIYDGDTVAITTESDALDTIAECLSEQTDGECECKFDNESFHQYFCTINALMQ